jgi:patched domain-containing protein
MQSTQTRNNNLFEVLFEKINNFYEKLYHHYGLFISKYYVWIICFSFTINLLLSMFIFNIHMITDTDELYMITNSRAKQDESYLKLLFNETYQLENKQFTHQLLDLGTWAEINFHVKNDPNSNIIKQEYFNEILSIHESILKNVYIIDSKTNQTLFYKDLCAKRMNNKCALEGAGLLNLQFFDYLWKKSEELNEKSVTIGSNRDFFTELEPYFSLETNTISFLRFDLGKHFKYQLNSSNEPAYARLFKIRYALKSPFVNIDPLVEQWEMKYLNYVENIKTNLTSFTYSTSKSLDYEMMANITLDGYLIASTFILITLFATLFMSINTNRVTSPGIILPLSGILSATFAFTSSLGFLSLLGYEACNLIFVIPFLVLGIGIDDMFIIYASFTQTKLEDTTSKRISETLSKASVSITITSLTDFIAFIVGTTANFKSVQIFCVYAAFSIAFCYFYQLTFFTGFLVLHSNRIKQNRNSFMWWIKYENRQEKIEIDELEQLNGPNEIKITQKSTLYTRFSKYLTTFYRFLLFNKLGKLLVGFLFLVYVSFSCWQALKIKEGMEIGDLVADDSYFRDYFKDNVESINLTPFIMIVFYKPIDYANHATRAKLKKFLNDIEKVDGVKKGFVLNWMEPFEDYLSDYAESRNDSILNEMTNDILPFSNDIIVKFNNETKQKEIVASRFYLQYEKLHFSSKDAIPMQKLRLFCEQSGLPVFPYAVTFKFYEQFDQTMPNILQSFVIAIEAMYLIAILFIPDLISAFCILLSMSSIMIGLIGFMHLWGLSLSSVTMIQLIMSIGFCVDFSVHITHSFIANGKKGSKQERAMEACKRTGLPIFNSAISTIVGILVLAFCKSYIFISFFKTLFILMVLGLLNSLIFLPVLLSLIGPEWNRHKI